MKTRSARLSSIDMSLTTSCKDSGRSVRFGTTHTAEDLMTENDALVQELDHQSRKLRSATAELDVLRQQLADDTRCTSVDKGIMTDPFDINHELEDRLQRAEEQLAEADMFTEKQVA